jgi:hypothetical protein
VRRIVGLLGLLLLSAGCGGPYRLSRPGERAELGLYTVDPQIPWNISSNRIWQSWTVDGFALHELLFVNGLKEGQALYPRLQQMKDPPTFRASMAPEDVAILFGSTIEFEGAKRVKRTEPKPQPFGSLAGHRIEVEYVDAAELEVQWLVAWVIHDHRLYAVSYRGAKEYYFPKYRNTVESILGSIRLSR